MPDDGSRDQALGLAYEEIDRHYAGESASTRRKFVAGATGALGTVAALSVPGLAQAASSHRKAANDPQTILNVAASAEVLATIVNTLGAEKVKLDRVTKRNVRTAAREELIHFHAIQSLGGKPASRKIWVPDAVFSDAAGLLNTLQVGDQIFINAYLIATTTFGDMGDGKTARYAAEFMGVEAVHRALARQSLGELGNDRAFMKYTQPEHANGAPDHGTPGFSDITVAVKRLEQAGFGFGQQGATPGRFFDFDSVHKRTPNAEGVDTRRVA